MKCKNFANKLRNILLLTNKNMFFDSYKSLKNVNIRSVARRANMLWAIIFIKIKMILPLRQNL